jgi:hypothetical protein
MFAFADADVSGEDMRLELGPFEVSEPASLIACSTCSTASILVLVAFEGFTLSRCST